MKYLLTSKSYLPGEEIFKYYYDRENDVILYTREEDEHKSYMHVSSEYVYNIIIIKCVLEKTVYIDHNAEEIVHNKMIKDSL